MEPRAKAACARIDDETPEHMSFAQIFQLLTDEERALVIAYAGKLKETRQTP